MNPFRDVTLCILGISLAASSNSLSQQRDRSKIPESYRWNLADLYPTDDAWVKAKETFASRIGTAEKNDGVLEQFREARRVSRRAPCLPQPVERPRQRILQALRVRKHGVRPGYAAAEIPRDGPGDGADRFHVRREGGVHRARASRHGEGEDRRVHQKRAEARDLPPEPRRRTPPERPHGE